MAQIHDSFQLNGNCFVTAKTIVNCLNSEILSIWPYKFVSTSSRLDPKFTDLAIS